MPGGGPPGRPGGGGIPLPIICGGALMPMPLPCGAICAAPITYARTCLLVSPCVCTLLSILAH